MHLYLFMKLNFMENNKNKQNIILKYASQKITKLLFVKLIRKNDWKMFSINSFKFRTILFYL